jgi:hypothetical protein
MHRLKQSALAKKNRQCQAQTKLHLQKTAALN